MLASALATGALLLGLASGASAFSGQESSTQPATELVMPFDATAGKATFLIVSNPHASSPNGGAKVTTHWTFWNQNCEEVADLSMCLTERDTIVVDPTNMYSILQDNETDGSVVDLTGQRGLVTVTAYETDSKCAAYDKTDRVLSRGAIVGTFTIADTNAGYSFGNDASGLFAEWDGGRYAVVLPEGPEAGLGRYVLQTLSPNSVDASLVVLGWLGVNSDGVAVPLVENPRFYNNYFVNLEVSTSLPDVTVNCVDFRSLTGGANPLIPDYVRPDGTLLPSYIVPASSGFLALTPVSGEATDRGRYLFAFTGQAVGGYGAASHAKIQRR